MNSKRALSLHSGPGIRIVSSFSHLLFKLASGSPSLAHCVRRMRLSRCLHFLSIPHHLILFAVLNSRVTSLHSRASCSWLSAFSPVVGEDGHPFEKFAAFAITSWHSHRFIIFAVSVFVFVFQPLSGRRAICFNSNCGLRLHSGPGIRIE